MRMSTISLDAFHTLSLKSFPRYFARLIANISDNNEIQLKINEREREREIKPLTNIHTKPHDLCKITEKEMNRKDERNSNEQSNKVIVFFVSFRHREPMPLNIQQSLKYE